MSLSKAEHRSFCLTKHSVGWGLVAGLVLLVAACYTPEEREALRVGSNTWLGYEPLYLARDEGMLDPETVRLVEMVSAADVLHAFRGRLLEGAAVTLDEALMLRAEGHELRVILVFDVSTGADGLVARPGIDSLEALRGRRVGFESNAVGAVMLEAALEKAGLGATEIEPVILAANDHLDAFRKGEVDAVVSFEPTLSRLVTEYDGRLLVHSGQFPDRIVDVLVVHEEVYRQRQGDLRRLLKGWFRAVEYLGREPRTAAARMGSRHGAGEAEILRGLDGMRLLDLEENRRMLSGSEAALSRTARSLTEIMLQRGLLSRPPKLTGLLGATPLDTL